MIFRCGGMSDSSLDGIGMSLDIFFQGCSRRCKGCQNPELQDKNGGQYIDLDYIIEHLEKYCGFYESMVFVGGEPLEQLNELICLIQTSEIFDLYSILYTGYLFKELPFSIRKFCDIIIDGSYRENLKTNGFPASSNQNIYIRGKKIDLEGNYNRSLMEIWRDVT